MKILLLTIPLSLFVTSSAFSAASVGLNVQQEEGELAVFNTKTKAGFIERGGKNYWKVIYKAEPGTYSITGRTPGCPLITQSSSFEEGKAYGLVLTKDCRITKTVF